MQSLYDRNYNTPQFGYLKSGDPLSGLQVRADVPNKDGRGNVRIDFFLDGRTEFEVENVPAGEEEICRKLIGGLSEAVAAEGMTLEVTDWGKAAQKNAGTSEPATRTVQVERERERQVEGTRGPAQNP